MEISGIDTNNSNLSTREKIQKGVWLCTPVILIGALLLSLAYITDAIFSGGIEPEIGETVALAKILYGTGSVINKLISPIISGAVSLFIGGASALAGGLVGGMLTGLGVTYYFSSGNTSAITGIYGSILAGLIAGYSIRFFKAFSNIMLKKTFSLSDYILPVLSVITTCIAVFIIDALARIINALSGILLASVGDFSKPLLCLLLGLMLTADIGGPLYLSALVYGVASIATNESEIMASVIGAGCVPAISLLLTTFVYKDKFTKNERYYLRLSAPCALLGINQVAIPFYASHLYKVILPSSAGGCITSLLCYFFGCKVLSAQGGILSLKANTSLLLFVLSVICGVLISTAIMGLLLDDKETTEKEQYPAKALPYGA